MRRLIAALVTAVLCIGVAVHVYAADPSPDVPVGHVEVQAGEGWLAVAGRVTGIPSGPERSEFAITLARANQMTLQTVLHPGWVLTYPLESLPGATTTLPPSTTSTTLEQPTTTATAATTTTVAPTTTATPSSTTTIPATTTSTAPPSIDGFPTQASAGLPQGWVPKRTITSQYWINDPGTVIEDWRFLGGVIVNAPNVTLRRVEVVDGEVNNWPGSDCNEGLLIEDSTLRGKNDGYPVVQAGGYTARNVEISGAAEGFRVGGLSAGCGPVVIEDSWVQVAPPPGCEAQGMDWHGDALQGYDGNAVTIRNTYLGLIIGGGDCGGTAPIFYPDGDGNHFPATIDGLIVEGGGFPFRVGRGSVRNLHIVDGSWVYGPIESNCSEMTEWEAYISTLDAAGQPVIVRSQPCDT